VNLLDVDLDAPRRIEGIAAAGLRALGAARQRSADVDKAVEEMFERRERARKELDEQVEQAGETEEKADEDRPKPKRTLSLGGEEFHQARDVRQAEAPPEPRNEPAPPSKLGARDDAGDEQSKPGGTLKLGARDDDEPRQEERPVGRPRPPRAEGDDDMSGRTWLR